MQKRNNRTFFSASDLAAFLECSHRTSIDLIDLDTRLERAAPDEQVELLQDKGYAHEDAYLDSLRASGIALTEIPKTGDFEAKLAATQIAMASGVSVIAQAALSDGNDIG